MVPDIQEDATPNEEVKPKEEVPRSFNVDAIFTALLFSIVRAVLIFYKSFLEVSSDSG